MPRDPPPAQRLEDVHHADHRDADQEVRSVGSPESRADVGDVDVASREVQEDRADGQAERQPERDSAQSDYAGHSSSRRVWSPTKTTTAAIAV